ncbi:MAG: helix-turn-helix transcriptional regulator [Oligoflexia bacterium]|nr:helix-turn-helix transcriptional regulator [Oligoflexia bacterium]
MSCIKKTSVHSLIDTYKRYLKKMNISYKDLADKMNVSESSIKKTLSSSSISLNKLFEFCEIVDLDFEELVNMNKKFSEKRFALTAEQEAFFTKNLDCLYFLFELYLCKRSVLDIMIRHKLSDKQLKHYTDILEKFELIKKNNQNEFILSKKGKFGIHSPSLLAKTLLKKEATYMLETALNDFPNANKLDKKKFLFDISHYRASAITLKKFITDLHNLIINLRDASALEQSLSNTADLFPLTSLVITNEEDFPFFNLIDLKN